MKTLLLSLTFSFLTILSFSQDKNAELFKKAYTSLVNKDYTKAHKYIDQVFKKDSSSADYFLLKSEIYSQMGNLPEAHKVMTLAVKKFPGNAVVLSQRGYYSHEMRNFEYALSDYLRANQLTSDQDVINRNYANLGGVYLNLRQFDKAYDVLDKCLKYNPNNAHALTNLALVCDQTGKLEFAIDYLLKAVDIEPENLDIRMDLGYIYQKLEIHEKAIENFNIVFKIQPDNAFNLNNRGFSKFKLGKTDEALIDIEKSIELNSNNSYAYKNRALIFIELKETEKACQDIQTAIDKNFVKFYGEEILELQQKHCK